MPQRIYREHSENSQDCAVLEGLVCAEDILILTGIEEYPECCFYVGQETVFVRLLGQSGQIYHIESVIRRHIRRYRNWQEGCMTRKKRVLYGKRKSDATCSGILFYRAEK